MLLEKEIGKLKKESKPVPLSLQALQRAFDLHYRSKGEVFCPLQHFGKDWEEEWPEKAVAKSRVEAAVDDKAKEAFLQECAEDFNQDDEGEDPLKRHYVADDLRKNQINTN